MVSDFFDTHTHLTDQDTDFQAYAQKAAESGVKYLMICSSGLADSRKSADFAEKVPNACFAVGIHPQDIDAMQQEKIEDFYKFRYCPRLAAIGEIGLDYYYESTDPQIQLTVFQRFLDLALQWKLPAIIHCRDKENAEQAYRDAYEKLLPFSQNGGRFVLHCFAGNPEWAARFAELGAYFGIGGLITFKKAENIRVMADTLPLDRVLMETDSPYLAPVPFRGKTNHPALLPYSAEAFARLKQKTTAEIRELTTRNAFRFFALTETPTGIKLQEFC